MDEDSGQKNAKAPSYSPIFETFRKVCQSHSIQGFDFLSITVL